MKNRVLPLSLISTFLGLSMVIASLLAMAGQPGTPELRKSGGTWVESVRANQHSGQVNLVDVIKARQQAEALRYKSTPSMGLNWISSGPDNFPGMMWSAIFDNTDPSGLTIIAGSSNGGIWKSINLGLSWAQMPVVLSLVPNVSSMVQSANGTIYAATGVSACKTTKYAGNGIYKSDATGQFSPITATVLNPDFQAVTQLAINSTTGRLYAATIGGLYYSDNGDEWVKALSGYAMDIKVGSDGTFIVAVGDSAYVAPGGDLNAKFCITTGASNALPKNGFGWMTFAIAPSDVNVMYTSLIDASGKLLNVYLSADKGATWQIVFPNNPTFEPYNGYGCYANTMAVSPNDPYQVYLGGNNMWYGRKVLNSGYYNWEQVSFGNHGSLSPVFVPLYHHSYLFRPNNANQLVIASDGGISVGTIADGYVTFQTVNKNLQSSQFNSVAYSAQKGYVMGGGDRIGTLAMGYFAPSTVSFPTDGYQIYRQDAASLSSYSQPQPANYCGTGGTCVWSSIDPRVAVYTKYKGDSTANVPFKAIRRQDFTDINKFNDFLGGSKAGDIYMDTVASAHVPMALWETFNQGSVFGITRDSVKIHAEQKTIPADTTILVPSNSNKVPFPYHTLAPVNKGDSLMVPDPLASRFFMYGRASVGRAIVMTLNMLRFDRPISYYIIFKDNLSTDPVTALTVSADLNTLWAGTSLGRMIRITGLLNAHDSATANYNSSQCVLVSTVFTNMPFNGRTVTSISIDPTHPNKVLVTLGNYGNQDYVYFTQNGADAEPVFNSIQGNLPQAPVFTGLLELHGNNVLVGTDNGVFTATNFASGSPQWTSEMQNIGFIPVTDIRQQVIHDYHITNYGVIYAATQGRGIWMDTTYYAPVGIDPGPGVIANNGTLRINPNPARDFIQINFVNETAGNLAISVYDLTGRQIVNSSLGYQLKGNVETTYPVGNLSNGTYIIKIGNLVGKFIKL